MREEPIRCVHGRLLATERCLMCESPVAAEAAETRHDWFTTVSGIRFFIEEPTAAMIDPVDIAHALAHVCRYGGHSRVHYSVAQHSVHVSRLVPPALARHGLMHDATEAYLGDVIAPLKRLLPGYRKLERTLDAVIAQRFGLAPLTPEEHQALRRADLCALMTERRDLMPPMDPAFPWLEDEAGVSADPQRIAPLLHTEARDLFLARFEELR